MKRFENEEDWDPMRDAFFSERFNSYQDGPGANLDPFLQPCFSRRPLSEKPPCKLFVFGIPPEMTKEAIATLFERYGKVQDVFLKEEKSRPSWALVHYQNISEGQMAINCLNGTPPFRFVVKFAHSKEEKMRRRKEKEDEEVYSKILSSNDTAHTFPVMESPYPRAFGRGRGIPVNPRPPVADIFSHSMQLKGNTVHYLPPEKYDYLYDIEDEMLCDRPIKPGVYSTYKGNLWDQYNAHIMDGVSLTVNSSHGGRRISLGRASSLPREEVRIPFRKNIHAMKYSNFDDNGFCIGKCSLCDHPSTLTCGVCGAWYCSPECQEEDWPRHKPICDCFRKALNYDSENVSRGHGRSSKDGDSTREREKELNKMEATRTQGRHSHEHEDHSEREGQEGRQCRSPPGAASSRMKFDQERQHMPGREYHGGDRGEKNYSSKSDSSQNSSWGQDKRTGERRNESWEKGQEERKRDSHGRNRGDDSRGDQMGMERGNEDRVGGMDRDWGRERPMRGGRDRGRGEERRRDGDRGMEGRDFGRGGDRGRSRGGRVGRGHDSREAGGHNRNEKGCDIPVETKQIEEEEWDSVKPTETPAPKHSEQPKPPVDALTDNLARCSLSMSESKASKMEVSPSSTLEKSLISEQPKLSMETFCEVVITSVASPNTYWVVKSDEYKEDGKAIMNALMKESENPCDKTFVPVVGSYCLALYEDTLCRAKIVAIRSTNAEIFFVDYGNSSTCATTELRKISQDISKYKSQAIKIVMAPGTPNEYLNLSDCTKVNVKVVPQKNESGALVVQVEGVSYEKKNPPDILGGGDPGAMMARPHRRPEISLPPAKPNPVQSQKMEGPPSCIELLQGGERIVCEIVEVLQDDKHENVAVIRVAFEAIRSHLEAIFQELPQVCESMKKDPFFRPTKGSLVAAYHDEEDWSRGIVIGKGPNTWKVAFCDVGIVTDVEKVQKLPERFQEVPSFAVVCQIINSCVPKTLLYSDGKIKAGSKLQLKILGKKVENSDVEVMCDVMHGDSIVCSGRLLAWRPDSKLVSPKLSETSYSTDSPPECLMLKNGCVVKVVHFFNLGAVYVQPCDPQNADTINKLLQDVAGACMPVGGRVPLNEVPPVGSIVGCKYAADGNFYRALVVDAKNPEEISVSFIDFGNVEKVALDLTCDLPENLKRIPCSAVKIGLKTTITGQLNKEASIYLSTLVLEEVELKYTCDDGDLRKCVLSLKNGSSVNDKLQGMLEPSWNKTSSKPRNPLAEEKTFNFADLTSDTFPSPSEKDGKYITLDLIVLSLPGKSTFVACRKDHPLTSVVYIEHKNKIQEYCENCPAIPYVPRNNEMCLAKFTGDGTWYRGFGMQSQSDSSMIYFVDYGNWEMVKHSDIRKMVPDFIEMPVLAVVCNYKGFDDETISLEAENKLKELLIPMQMYKSRIWKSVDGYETVVDIPEVTDGLIKGKYLTETLFKS